LFIISAVVADIFVAFEFTLFVLWISFVLLLLLILLLLLLLVELFTRKWLKVFQSLFIYEKSRNSSWLNALTIIGSIGVKVGSSDVKSLSKLLVSRSSFYLNKKEHKRMLYR
jgi:ABC-type multidrug transport system fused ATPase/permease subunit